MVKYLKHIGVGLRISIWLALLMLLYVMIWLQGGTRDLGFARGWMTSALNPPGAPYDISIGAVAIRWADITDFGELRVRKMVLSRKDGGIFAQIPEVTVTLDPFGFLPSRRSLHGVVIDNPRLFVTRDEQGVVRLGIEGVSETLPMSDLVAFFSSDDNSASESRGRLPFRAFTLNDARLDVSDALSGTVLKSTHLNFNISRGRNDLHGELSLPFTFNERAGNITASLGTQPLTQRRLLNLQMQAIPMELLCVFDACPENTQIAGNLSGGISLHKDRREPIEGGHATLKLEDALIAAPDAFPKPVKLRLANLQLAATNSLRDFTIKSLSLKLPETTIRAKGAVQRRDDGVHVQAQTSVSGLHIGKLGNYWPIPLARETREWVITHLSKGVATGATAVFDMQPADYEGETMRDEALRATVMVEGMDVEYIPGFPVLKQVDGQVDFTGKTLKVKTSKGSLLSATKVQTAELTCDNLDDPRVPMKSLLKLNAPASDVATLLKLPPFTFDDGIALNPATIQGSVDATLKLGFDGFSGEDGPATAATVNFSKVAYDVSTVLTNVGQPKLLDGRNISGLSGTLTANDAGVDFNGTMKLEGGTDVALTLKDAGGTTSVTAKGKLARSQFSNFGIPDIKQLGEGSIGVDVEVKLAKALTTLNRATIDLTPMALRLDELSWSKPAGTAAKLAITPGNAANRYGIAFEAPGLSIGKASLTMTPAMDDLVSISLPSVKSGGSNFALDYATKPGGYAITLKGASLDIAQYFSGTPETPADPAEKEKPTPTTPAEKGLLADFPALDLTVNLDQFLLVKGAPLSGVNIALRCDMARCNSATASATAGNAQIRAGIAPADGKRQFELSSTDAGDFLRALDVSERMYGGTLSIKGTYDDTKTPAPFYGRLLIEKFKLKNSEILARIISIGSLSGLVNVLTGQGIDFDKLGADIGALNGVFNVTKGRIDGNALGLTSEGSIDTNASTLAIKGVVVPANSLNSLFGKIPLIGRLAGGEGEGLIAFNYSVKGPMANPDVMVNPLSGLTPGFLRGIFNIGDQQTPAVPTGKTEPTQEAEEVPQKPVPWPSEKGRR